MDCQYEYVPVDPSDHYGFLSHHTGECIDPMAEKRVTSLIAGIMEQWNDGMVDCSYKKGIRKAGNQCAEYQEIRASGSFKSR